MALTAPNPVHEASGPPQATRTLESPTLDARSGFTINHQHPYPFGVLPKRTGGQVLESLVRPAVSKPRAMISFRILVPLMLGGGRGRHLALGHHRLRRPLPGEVRTGVEKPVHGLGTGRYDRPQFTRRPWPHCLECPATAWSAVMSRSSWTHMTPSAIQAAPTTASRSAQPVPSTGSAS